MVQSGITDHLRETTPIRPDGSRAPWPALPEHCGGRRPLVRGLSTVRTRSCAALGHPFPFLSNHLTTTEQTMSSTPSDIRNTTVNILLDRLEELEADRQGAGAA